MLKDIHPGADVPDVIGSGTTCSGVTEVDQMVHRNFYNVVGDLVEQMTLFLALLWSSGSQSS